MPPPPPPLLLPPPPPAARSGLAELIANEHFNIYYLLAILIPVFTAITGTACLWRYRQNGIKAYHKALALQNAQVNEAFEEEVPEIISKPEGASSYLFTTMTRLSGNGSGALGGGSGSGGRWSASDVQMATLEEDSAVSLLSRRTSSTKTRQLSSAGGSAADLEAAVMLSQP